MTQTPQSPAPPVLPPELDPRQRQPAPTVLPGQPRSRWRRVVWWIAAALSLLVLAGSVTGYVALRYYDGRIGRIDIGLPGHTPPASSADGKAENYLIVGSDTRDAPGAEAFQAPRGSPDFVTGQRSDTMILVHIPSGKAKATIVSFPRDSWVRIPAYTDAKGVRHAAHAAKLNSAFSLGGPPLLIATLQDLTGVKVDHYVQVDFVGFQHMVDALGGVTVCVSSDRADKDSGDYLRKGTHRLSGQRALAFVRDRKGLPRGDLDRIATQQYFLSVVLHKVLSLGTLANPFKLNAFLKAATAAVTVDRGTSFGDLRTLALRMRHLDPGHVSLVTAPISDDSAWRDRQQVVLLDGAKMEALFDSLRGEQPRGPASPSGPAAPTKPLTVAPVAISVQVYNGAGTSGLAGRAARDLRAVGFSVVGTGNRVTGAAQTVVRYGPSRADSARTLAAAVPGSTLQLVPSLGRTLELVVGSDYAGSRRVTVGSTPRAQPGGRATPGSAAPPKGTTAAQAARSCAP